VPKEQIQHVSDTALWVAGCRAIETERPDALFRDPLAVSLAGERGLQIATTMRNAKGMIWSVAEFFTERGWRLKEMRYLGEESQAVRRPVPLPPFVRLMRAFASRERRRQMLRNTGYANLERADRVLALMRRACL